MNFNNINDYSEYYANQLILQYISKPKARETIKAIARNKFINFGNIGAWRHLDVAEGDALIALAELFGISGFYDGVDYAMKYFAVKAYRQGGNVTPYQEGFQTYNSAKDGFFLKYSDVKSNAVLVNLSVFELRGMIRMRALYFTSDFGATAIQDVLDSYYPGCYISEKTSPPTIIYNVLKRYNILFGLLMAKRYILKPDGVAVEVSLIN